MLATLPLAALVRRIAPNSESVSDAELIERFAKSADQAAFELLVWRHGAMVWSACRRMLAPDHHATEDACQATFVALAMHAVRLRNCGAVAAWLHRVAVRAALDLAAARRSVLPIADSLDLIDRCPGPEQTASDREIRTLIDAGLDRLPDSLRIPFVLCELEGRTNAEAAAVLGCPIGTVESRLTRARQRLRTWLRSRGVAPALVLATVAFPESVRAALVSVGAARSAINPAVSALAERAVRSAAGMKPRFVLAIGVAMIATAIGLGLEAGDPPKNLDVPNAKTAGLNASEAKADDALPEGAIARLGSPRLRHGSRLKDIAYSQSRARTAALTRSPSRPKER
jgi:RNA polymerase sigma factor (sigma-70 family)